MTLLEDLPRALKGAWRLFVWDAEGVNYFDQTVDGFWRSFLVQLILLPIFYLAIVENHNILSAALELKPELSERPMAPLTAFVWANMSSFVLGIVAFPVLMIFIARMLRLTAHYVPMIIAYNWARVIIVGIVAIPMALHAMGILGMAAASSLAFLGVIIQPFYLFSIFRATTDAPPMTVVGLVVFEISLGLAIALGTEQLFIF